MNRSILTASAVLAAELAAIPCPAQDNWEKAFNDFRNAQSSEYQIFAKKVNARYVKALKKNWEAFTLEDAVERPPKKPVPVTAPEGEMTESIEIDISDIAVTLPAEYPDNEVSASYSGGYECFEEKNVTFNFYGQSVTMSIPAKFGTFHPQGISEKEVSSFWSRLASSDYSMVTSRYLKCRYDMNLNDWGTYEWASALSEAIFPNDVNGEQTIFTVFTLSQIGLMCNIARINGRLECIFASRQAIYGRKFILIGEDRYYVAGDRVKTDEAFTYKTDFKRNARPFDMRLRKPLQLGSETTTVAKPSSVFGTTLSIPLSTANLDFYASYPQTDVDVYATAIPERLFARTLSEGIRPFIEGRSQVEALNILLAFLQKDFRYCTDKEQFGHEKPFFCEENFLYAGNDCEDRSALFCFLVKDMLGLDCFLLQYPGHVDCAVCLDTDLKGYYVRRGDKKYFICDPTYIGAGVGMSSIDNRTQPEKIWFLN